MHLEMKLTVPTVESQPGFLRRLRAGTLNGSQVLGENHSPLQLRRSTIAAVGEFDRRPALPEASPVLRAFDERRVNARRRQYGRAGKRRHELETNAARAWSQSKLLPTLYRQKPPPLPPNP